jgi:hypothetical protein
MSDPKISSSTAKLVRRMLSHPFGRIVARATDGFLYRFTPLEPHFRELNGRAFDQKRLDRIYKRGETIAELFGVSSSEGKVLASFEKDHGLSVTMKLDFRNGDEPVYVPRLSFLMSLKKYPIGAYIPQTLSKYVWFIGAKPHKLLCDEYYSRVVERLLVPDQQPKLPRAMKDLVMAQLVNDLKGLEVKKSLKYWNLNGRV